jgi:tetratricopeptide (TPR) repeat protein
MLLVAAVVALLQEDALEEGRAKLKAKDLEGAAASFTKAIEADPKSATAWAARADALYRAGELEKAVSDWSKAVDLGKKADHYAARGIARLRLRQADEAGADFAEALKIDRDCALAIVGQAEIALSSGDFDAANEGIGAALRLQPALPEGLYMRGLLKQAFGNARGMLNDVERALRADPLHVEARLLRATSLADGGDPAGAIKDLDELVKLRPKADGLWAMRATVRSRAQDTDGALADYAKAIELNPKGADHYVRRAYLYRATLKEYGKAIADYTSALELEPENTGALTGRGYAYCRTKDWKSARGDMARAYELKPEDPWGAYNYACYYGLRAQATEGDEKKKSVDKAFEWLREARKAGYTKLQGCGCHGTTLKHLQTDSDLDALHEDKRWPGVSAADEDE